MVQKRICMLCGSEKSLFSFPKEKSMQGKWLKYINKPNHVLLVKDKICSSHFAPDQFKHNNLKRLKDDACPSDLVYDHKFNCEDHDIHDADQNIKEPDKKNKQQCSVCGFVTANSFFGFPRKLDVRLEWAKFCDILPGEIKPYHRLCDKHFKPEDYRLSTQRKLLSTTSIPSLFPKENSGISKNNNSKLNYVSDSTSNVNSSLENVICSPDAQISLPPKRYFRFFGDITEDDVIYPETAKLALKMAKEEVAKYRQKLNCFRNENSKLKKRCARLTDSVAELQKRIKLNDDAYFD